MAANTKVKAIGEIGLDYHYDFSPREVQKQRFMEQIDLAKQLKLPIIVHDRESHGDIMEIFTKMNVKGMGGVLHSFSGSVEMARECLKLGFYLSISGPYFQKQCKNSGGSYGNAFGYAVIETDSPYLTPAPYRGQRNYPGYEDM